MNQAKTEIDSRAAALAPLVERVRTDVTAVRGKNGVAWTREPLTPTRIARHLNGGPARGVCPIGAGESTLRAAALDLDSHKGEVAWPEMVETAITIMEASARAGIRLSAFRSYGGKGIHLYALWDAPQDAYSVRRALRAVLAEVGLEDGTGGVGKGQVEIYPRQDSVPEDGFGNQFILPLAGQSVALDPLELEPMDAGDLVWPVSEPVEMVPHETISREIIAAAPVDLQLVRDAIAAIPNAGEHELDYEPWRDLIFAIHAATGGSEEGLELAHELSRKSAKYDEAFLDRNVWPHIKTRPDGITVQTLFNEARRHGFNGDIVALFEDLGPLEVVEAGDGHRPQLNFSTDDNGRPLATIGNVHKALAHSDYTGIDVGFDEFRDELMVSPRNRNEWRPFKDVDYGRLRLLFDGLGFKPVSDDIVRTAVHIVASERSFDSARLWLENEVPAWDGLKRIENFYGDYLDTVDSSYARSIGKYMWTAMAGRVLQPGCKADMVPIWVSKQGTAKTTSVAALVVSPDHFAEVKLDQDEEKIARLTRGVLVAELNELRGLHTKDMESIKAWVTRTHEKWIPKYQEFSTTYPRRFLPIGTSNQDEFLGDETGNRRWLPIRVGTIDRKGIERDRLQLWAEARDAFMAAGVGWQGVVELAQQAHEEFRISDSWEESILAFVNTLDPRDPNGLTRGQVGITTFEVLNEGLGHDVSKIGKAQEMRVGKILRVAGFNKVFVWQDGRNIRKWRFGS